MRASAPVDLVCAAVGGAIARVGVGLYGVACSGGGDSIALADAVISKAGARHVVVLTIDHGLTPGSAATAGEVAAWARQHGAVGIVRRVELARRASLEAAARDARYAALAALADELGLAAIFVGHTASDQAETVLMRVLRGTGPAGLAAIPEQRDRIVRPLLGLPRETIEAYIAARGLPTWLDPMNGDRRLARVRIRCEILPSLRRENPQLDLALVRRARSAAEWLVVIDRIAGPLARWPIDCAALAGHPPAIRKRALAITLDRTGIEYNAVHLEQLDRVVCAPCRGEITVELPGHQLVRSYDRLELATGAQALPELTCATRPALLPPHGYRLRTWLPGDRMNPVRLAGRSRKLSDLFIDAKVSRRMRAAARVLIRLSDGVIVWVEHLGGAFGEPDDHGSRLGLDPTRSGGSF